MSADGQPSSEAALLITVSDPEKHGTSITAAFVDYKLSTVTQLSRYAAKEFFVRRRYRDFVWLRDRLCHAFPGCVVPPLPTVDSPLKDDRFSPNFIERRQAGLQLFLRRVVGHERLRESSDLQTFLEAKVWELQTVKNATGSSWLGALFDGTQESLKSVQSLMAHKVPDEEAIERVRAFAANYATIASASASKQHAAVRTQADMASDLRQLAPALDMLSQSETELSLPLTHMAAALDRVKELHLARVQAEHVCGLSALLAFNTGMATALSEVLANRDAALLQYQKAAAALDASTKERQRWQEAEHSGAPSPRSGVLGKLDELMYDPQKGSKVEVRVKEADAELSAAKERWEAISTSIHTEVDRFHRQTNADFSRGLREHVLEQLEFEQAQQREWEQLLDIVERVETVPGTAASFRPSSS